MGQFEAIEHTADVGVVVRAETAVELFETAAEAMLSLIVDPRSVENRAWTERAVEADDLEGLLVAWLNDLLLVLSVDEFVPRVFVIDHLGEGRLRATLHGEPFDPARHFIRKDVKAATHHMLRVEQGDGWSARIIFDV